MITIRLLFWLLIYIIFLGIVSFDVKYKDGLIIKLKGWPEFIMKWEKK